MTKCLIPPVKSKKNNNNFVNYSLSDNKITVSIEPYLDI